MKTIDMSELKTELASSARDATEKKEVYMRVRKMFDGMLPAAIRKFEELLKAAEKAGLRPVVEKGYDATAGKDSYFYWGCACRITCDDMAQLKTLATGMGITWLNNNGDMAYTNKRKLTDFKAFKVNGELETVEPIKIEPIKTGGEK